MALDRKKLEKRVLTQLLGHPLTVWPAVGGVAALLAALALPFGGAIPAFIGLAGIATGAGTLALRWLYKRDDILEQSVQRMEREAQQAREADLDTLHADLQADGDPRTEALLSDMRELTAMVRDEQTWPDITSSVRFDILAGVEELFAASVGRLRLSLTLYERAYRIRLTAAREPLLNQREALINQVARGIAELGRILAEIQGLGIREVNEEDLSRIIGQLERSVEAERQTQASLDDEIARLGRAVTNRQPEG